MKIGNTMKKIREDKKITQDEIIDNEKICTRRTINNIESDTVVTSFATIYELASNMGLSLNVIEQIGLKNNFSIYKCIKEEIEIANNISDYKSIQGKLIMVSDAMYNELPLIEKQFMLAHRASVTLSYEHNVEQAKEIAFTALYMTFKPDNEFYTENEAMLLNIVLCIEQSEYWKNEVKKAVDFSFNNYGCISVVTTLKLLNGLCMMSLKDCLWSDLLTLSKKAHALSKAQGNAMYMIQFSFLQGLALYHINSMYKQTSISILKDAMSLSLMLDYPEMYASFEEDISQFKIEI